jgi:NADH dehydrogenase FAD-containing subunit
MVTGVDEHGVTLGQERLESRTVLWAAGVSASPLAKSLGAPLDKAAQRGSAQRAVILSQKSLLIPQKVVAAALAAGARYIA